MDHLLRDLAPIPATAWSRIDDEARERLTPLLAARRVVDWTGPGGWARSARDLGRGGELSELPAGGKAASARLRRVLPLAELRVAFTVDRAEIDDAERGATDLELDDLDRAAQVAAEIENRAVFHGWPAANIEGVAQLAPARNGKLGTDPTTYPGVIAAAVDRLRLAGVQGPYALAVAPKTHTRIIETTENTGYLLLDHLTRILGGEVIWSSGLEGAIVLSKRGGDFHLDVGQDLSIGYSHHDADTVHLYLEESFTFKVSEPDAAIALTA
jgi:uncharacterized linocin/CFP29 family protein